MSRVLLTMLLTTMLLTTLFLAWLYSRDNGLGNALRRDPVVGWMFGQKDTAAEQQRIHVEMHPDGSVTVRTGFARLMGWE